jgi:hypothetical protein
MKRRLNMLTALSLLLGVALSILWARSYWRQDVWLFPHCRVGTCKGTISLLVWWGGASWYGDGGLRWESDAYVDSFDHLPAFGLTMRKWTPGLSSSIPSSLECWAPLWPAAVGCLVVWCYLAWRHSIRPPAGHCQQCGYDLRASPRGCPECGAAASTAS